MTIPIMNDRTNEPVGVIICQLFTDVLQIYAENTIKHNEEVTTVAVYTNTVLNLAVFRRK